MIRRANQIGPFNVEGKDIKEEIEVCKYCRCEKCMRPDWG